MSTDYSLTTFDKRGELTQIKYALNAVAKGETCLGIRAKNGVMIACEKKVSSILFDEEIFNKVASIYSHVGAANSGIGPDFRVTIKKARKDAQAYNKVYHDSIPMFVLCKELAELMQEFTQSGGVRPFGISLLVAGYDESGPHLY